MDEWLKEILVENFSACNTRTNRNMEALTLCGVKNSCVKDIKKAKRI